MPTPRTDLGYEQRIERDRRWNFAVNASDLVAVNLAKSFIFSSTILTLYASYLTSSAVLIGLIPAIQQVGYLLPQLLTARKSETLARFKPYVVRISVMERLPYLFIALAIFAWPGAPSWFAYAMLAVNIGVATGCAGLATPPWKGMLAKVIHPDRRGLLFSLGVGAGGLLGVGGAWLSRAILEHRPFPISYGLCFLLAFAGQAISFFFLTLNREPKLEVTTTAPSLRDYMAELPQILRGDRNFSRYLASQTLFIVATMASSFYVIYGRYHFGLSDGFAAGLTMVALLTQSAGTPVLGALSDRLGHKWLGEASSWLGAAALVMMLFIPGPGWLYPVFILANLAVAGMGVSRSCITMEFGRSEKLPTFTALSGTLLGIPSLVAPVLGGWILDAAGFGPLFAAALAAALAGWAVLRWGVTDPRMSRRRPAAGAS
jgi:MFS family permease